VTKPAPGPDQPPIPVRLVTLNTHHGVGPDERHDLPRLATLLASADADVICLQEVDRRFDGRSEDVDQALLLSRALDMQLAWGPAIEDPGDPERGYGNVLLSRLPLLVSDVHRLPGGGEPRIALRTTAGHCGSPAPT
jgi:endonuclease/exonuclease/phosphatase family metal-dependent hydrolase